MAKDYGRNSVEEEIKLTVDRVPGDKGQEALKESVKTSSSYVYGFGKLRNVTVNITVLSLM